jgi:protein TonB
MEIASKTLPSEPIVAVGGNADIDWKIEPLDTASNIIQIDTNEQPLYRSQPIMPQRAQKSGHCMMRFDVSAEVSRTGLTTRLTFNLSDERGNLIPE